MGKLFFYLALFFAIGLVGVYYHMINDGENKRLGIIETRAVVVGHTEPVRRSSSSSTVDWNLIVRFNHLGKEETVQIYGIGRRSDYKVGEQVPLLLNSQDWTKSSVGTLASQKQGWIIMMAIGFGGALIFAGILLYQRFK